MGIPRVAIVGRPNVGKSSLLNWLAERMLSVVDPTAGVTRDRVTWIMHERDRWFELVDTGGIGIVDSDELSEDIERQIQIGLEECELLLFVVDAQVGITPLDQEVASRLRRSGKPMVLVANKCDSEKLAFSAGEFLALADLPLVATSVKGNRWKAELIRAIVDALPPADDSEEGDGTHLAQRPEMRLAIVGRRNVGKSTFINQLAEQERVIVSDVAGTTRDSIDVRFEVDGHSFVAIDTPGVRKRKSLANDIEFYGLVRAKRSIRRADVVLMFFDATQTISRVDKQLVDEIQQYHKPCIFVVNKWDLGLEQEMTTSAWGDYLLETFNSMRYVPVAIITAKEGRNVRKLVNLAQVLHKQAHERLSTGRLNRAVREAIAKRSPPSAGGRRARIYYATQVEVAPPTIVLKCNDPKLFHESWKRFLLNQLREKTPFQEIPVRLIFRANTDASVGVDLEEALPAEFDEEPETDRSEFTDDPESVIDPNLYADIDPEEDDLRPIDESGVRLSDDD